RMADGFDIAGRAGGIQNMIGLHPTGGGIALAGGEAHPDTISGFLNGDDRAAVLDQLAGLDQRFDALQGFRRALVAMNLPERAEQPQETGLVTSGKLLPERRDGGPDGMED